MLQNIFSVSPSLETRSETFPAFEKTLALNKKNQTTTTPRVRQQTKNKFSKALHLD